MHTFVTILSLTLVVHGQMFGTGSSRHEDNMDQEIAAEYKEMIEDKEHIQEEFDNMFSKQQIRQMTPDELAITWFR